MNANLIFKITQKLKSSFQSNFIGILRKSEKLNEKPRTKSNKNIVTSNVTSNHDKISKQILCIKPAVLFKHRNYFSKQKLAVFQRNAIRLKFLKNAAF